MIIIITIMTDLMAGTTNASANLEDTGTPAGVHVENCRAGQPSRPRIKLAGNRSLCGALPRLKFGRLLRLNRQLRKARAFTSEPSLKEKTAHLSWRSRQGMRRRRKITAQRKQSCKIGRGVLYRQWTRQQCLDGTPRTGTARSRSLGHALIGPSAAVD